MFPVLFMLLYVVTMILSGSQPDTNRKYVVTLFCLLETTKTGSYQSQVRSSTHTKISVGLPLSHDSGSLGSSGYLNAVVGNN